MYQPLSEVLEIAHNALKQVLPEHQVPNVLLHCKKQIENLAETDSIPNLMHCFSITRGFQDSYEITVFPLSTEQEVEKTVDESIEESNYIHKVYGDIRLSNIKRLAIKEVTVGEAMAAISTVVYPKLPEYFTTEDRKLVVFCIVNEIVLGSEYIFITKTDKILFNFNDVLYYAPINKTVFIPADSKTKELLVYEEVLDLILGKPTKKKVISNTDFTMYYP